MIVSSQLNLSINRIKRVKKQVMVVLGVMVSVLGLSQDLVVTVNRDSIACKVVGFSDDSLFYTIGEPSRADGKTAHRYALNQADVLVYRVNFQAEQAVVQQQAQSAVGRSWQRFRLSANIGLSYSLDPDGHSGGDLVVPNDVMYLSVIKGGDVAWFFSPNWGVGLAFHQYNTSVEYDYIAEIQGNGYTYLDYIYGNDVLNLTYYGPLLLRRKPLFKEHTQLMMGLSVGRVLYHKTKDSSVGNYVVTGKAFGGFCEFGLESRLTRHLTFGAKASLFAGWINQRSWDDGHTIEVKPVERIDRDLHRLDLSIGLRVLL